MNSSFRWTLSIFHKYFNPSWNKFFVDLVNNYKCFNQSKGLKIRLACAPAIWSAENKQKVMPHDITLSFCLNSVGKENKLYQSKLEALP